MNHQKGAITMIIFAAMLVFSIYGTIFLGNSVNAFNRQTKMIESIQNVYAKDIENAYQIAETLSE